MRAAEYYRLPPWELVDRPVGWVKLASKMVEAQDHARKIQERSSPWV